MKKSKMNKISFSVNSGAILLEAAQQFNQPGNHSPGMVEGLEMIRAGLVAIAERAIALEDKKLLEILQYLGCVKAREKQT